MPCRIWQLRFGAGFLVHWIYYTDCSCPDRWSYQWPLVHCPWLLKVVGQSKVVCSFTKCSVHFSLPLSLSLLLLGLYVPNLPYGTSRFSSGSSCLHTLYHWLNSQGVLAHQYTDDIPANTAALVVARIIQATMALDLWMSSNPDFKTVTARNFMNLDPCHHL